MAKLGVSAQFFQVVTIFQTIICYFGVISHGKMVPQSTWPPKKTQVDEADELERVVTTGFGSDFLKTESVSIWWQLQGF